MTPAVYTRRPKVLSNLTCPYCAKPREPGDRTKDHAIGRRFVPAGWFAGRWNLLLRAHKVCNGKKADLEDDISALSMQIVPTRDLSSKDETPASEAIRKSAGSISRSTRKPGGKMTVSTVGPPQLEEKRVFELARLQLMAFFYAITYNETARVGGFWLGGFFPVAFSLRSDWGNAVNQAFMSEVVDWEPRVHAGSPDDYFRIVIRRHPSAVCWSWALEWNRNVRVFGFFGEREPAEIIADRFRRLEMVVVSRTEESVTRMRQEVALADRDDTLFFLPPSWRPPE